MSSGRSEWGVAIVCAIGAVGVVGWVAISGTAPRDTAPVPVPSATTMRTAGQPGTVTYPDCRDTDERPCVRWAEDSAWLVTETGASLPAIPVSRDEKPRPRMITIR